MSPGNSNVAQNGHLEVLQCARSQGCPWDSDTCYEAAQNGHLEVLQWARSPGIVILVLKPLGMVMWQSCSGPGASAVQ